jgi:hypothetical protein
MRCASWGPAATTYASSRGEPAATSARVWEFARRPRGVELVLHAASDPHYRRGAGDPQQTRNLFAACAHVRHLLYVSIVGVHQIPLRYYAHKLECERLVNEGGLSHALAEGRNTTPAHADGRLTWAQYFARR